jgi:hypothetical protein
VTARLRSHWITAELLPQLQPLGEFALRRGEVLIAAPGFEDRTRAIPDALPLQSAGTAILLDYRPTLITNQLSAVRSLLQGKGISVSNADILEYDRFDPNSFPDRLRCRLSELEANHVIVDISTMSKLAAMLVLNACLVLQLTVTIVYAEASTYGPSESEFLAAREKNAVHRPSLQVFTGVYGVVRIACLTSVAMQGQPTAAIAFMSFNDALTQVLLNTVYPARLFLINSRPPTHSWREHATAWIHEQVRHEWETDNPLSHVADEQQPLPTRAASTLDYRETVDLLLALYWELSSTHRVLLAPAGSKMQAIACFIVKALHPDIHIEYPSPEGFAREYSSGIGSKWKLELGHLPTTLFHISAAEKNEYFKLKVPLE